MDRNEAHDLLIDLDALKASMEKIMAGSTPDHAKWYAYKDYARAHCDLARRYQALTGDAVNAFDADNMKSPGSLVWPVHKQIFDNVYTEVSRLQARLSRRLPQHMSTGFDDLLHPAIRDAAVKHFQDGDFRNAVLDAVIALFDLLRRKSGIQMDGENLCNRAFSPNRPVLIFSELDTESGQNDQRGFMDIFKGVYRGVRNPKAHSLVHDLDSVKAGQYLVLMSLLARRVDESTLASATDEANAAEV